MYDNLFCCSGLSSRSSGISVRSLVPWFTRYFIGENHGNFGNIPAFNLLLRNIFFGRNWIWCVFQCFLEVSSTCGRWIEVFLGRESGVYEDNGAFFLQACNEGLVWCCYWHGFMRMVYVVLDLNPKVPAFIQIYEGMCHIWDIQSPIKYEDVVQSVWWCISSCLWNNRHVLHRHVLVREWIHITAPVGIPQYGTVLPCHCSVGMGVHLTSTMYCWLPLWYANCLESPRYLLFRCFDVAYEYCFLLGYFLVRHQNIC